MAQLPLWQLQQEGTFNWASGFGFYVKLSVAPIADMTLLDLDGAGRGYMRVKVTSARLITLETLINGLATSLTPNTGSPLSTGQWYWVAVSGITPQNDGEQGHQIALYNRNGLQLNQVAQGHTARISAQTTTYDHRAGIGVSLTSAYLNFPYNPGLDEMSKLVFVTHQTGLITPPAVDPTGLAYYNARQTTGVASSLTDGSGTYTATTVGPNGLAVNLDGPFVS